METVKISTVSKQVLADTITPVSIYLKVRDIFPNAVLLESSDYHGNKNSMSYIALDPVATFMVDGGTITEQFYADEPIETPVTGKNVIEKLDAFVKAFDVQGEPCPYQMNGLFGYTAWDGIPYFETLNFDADKKDADKIPEVRYSFYRYVIAINHFKNNLCIIENLRDGEVSQIGRIEELLKNRNFAQYKFDAVGEELSNMDDDFYKDMVAKGKEHCARGDVFQIVLSRRFRQHFKGDEFNVYRALRSINPSPYLFYFDYGNYRLFGSSPEAEIVIEQGKAYIHPIAGTFKRTGDDAKDRELATQLMLDPKENSEHVMLVDLARNDLSRNAENVQVETFKEIQYFSHVLHMVSVVGGDLPEGTNPVQILADTFPAGTLSGAPKYKAMQLIDKYEPTNRSYYGGAIGILGFNGDVNHAIMIRSFLSKNNTLTYQAGAGIVISSKEENELAEVNNKLAALKKAIIIAKEI